MRGPKSIGLCLGVGHVCALLLGCGQTDGLVEVAWQVDDGSLARIYPNNLPNVCDLPSQSGIRYDLRVQLTVVANTEACTADPGADGCEIIEPLLFPCNRFRGTGTSVPASATSDSDDPGYLMIVEMLIDPTDTAPFVPNASCMRGPGPRVRNVTPGRVTDLEVYQFVFGVFDLGGRAIDIDACRPEALPDPGETETGGSEAETGGSEAETGGTETGAP